VTLVASGERFYPVIRPRLLTIVIGVALATACSGGGTPELPPVSSPTAPPTSATEVVVTTSEPDGATVAAPMPEPDGDTDAEQPPATELCGAIFQVLERQRSLELPDPADIEANTTLVDQIIADWESLYPLVPGGAAGIVVESKLFFAVLRAQLDEQRVDQILIDQALQGGPAGERAREYCEITN
jgi:hypothetical protein